MNDGRAQQPTLAQPASQLARRALPQLSFFPRLFNIRVCLMIRFRYSRYVITLLTNVVGMAEIV